MRNKRAWQAITVSMILLLAVWLLFACVAPRGATPEPAAQSRDLTGTCQTFTSTDVPKAIPDRVGDGVYTSSQLPVTAQGYITDIEVTFTIDSQSPDDLNVVLCGPRNLSCDLLYNGALTWTPGVCTVAFSSDPTNGSYYDLAPPYTGSYPTYPDNYDGGEIRRA